jgi:hypothetical protein
MILFKVNQKVRYGNETNTYYYKEFKDGQIRLSTMKDINDIDYNDFWVDSSYVHEFIKKR